MMKYNTIFYYSDIDNAYVTSVPRLPGCMSDGKTIEEAIRNTHRVIDEWVQDAMDDGEPIPEEDEKVLISSNCTVDDVAGYILNKTGPITAMMLEKLTYYTLAWSLAWYEKPLFAEPFQAWRNGPVCPKLYETHKGKKVVSNQQFPHNHQFTNSEMKIIDAVLVAYGDYDAEQLSQLTHREDPWMLTRGELDDSERSHRMIPYKLLKGYYGQIVTEV